MIDEVTRGGATRRWRGSPRRRRPTSSARSTPSCSASAARSPRSRRGSARWRRSTRSAPPARRSTRRRRAVAGALDERRRELAARRARRRSWRPSGSTSPRCMARPRRGHAHLVTQAWERLEDVFIGLGFQVAEGPEVETDWYNFEALNMPPEPSGARHARHASTSTTASRDRWCCARTPRRCRSA